MDTRDRYAGQQTNNTKFEGATTAEAIDRLKEGEYLEIVKKLRLELNEKSNECEILKIKLNESNQDVEKLGQELNECKLSIFENNEYSKKTHEEVLKSKKLEEDYVKLMSDFLALGKRTDQYKQNLIDNYLIKSNAINNYECLMSSGAVANELDSCKTELDIKLAELNLTLAKLRNLEEDNSVKEKTITELRKALDDAKITHKHEITVLEEYIQCLKNTIVSYEKTLSNYGPRAPSTTMSPS